jgi:glycosyltransferase involved in cell wall biosynthesis
MDIGNQPLVSIIMPTYNRAAFIMETIESIIAQSYTNWELLVVDDGSTDNTEELVHSLKDARINYHKFERTGITGRLKNFGINKARGALIAIMDSDDLWPPQKLQKQVGALLAYGDAGFSFTNGFNFITPYQPQVYFYEQREGVECRNVFIDQCTNNIGIRTPTLMFWKNCLEKIGMFNENRLFTDFSFITALACYFPAVILYEPLLYRRIHPGNNANTNSYDDYLEYFETVRFYLGNGRLQPPMIKKALFLAHIYAGDTLRAIKKLGAFIHYLQAWRYNRLSFIPFKRMGRVLFN